MSIDSSDELEEGMAAYDHGDYVKAFELLVRFAEKGMAPAQCMVASMYHLGFGVPINGAEALKWYHRAAEQGYALAYNNLGSLYATGCPGVPVDREKAKECYRRAVECGFEMIPHSWYD